jgi:aspartate kinase
MTADPRIIDDARTISALSYDEAAELSYFGAKVLHPLTIIPASLKNIPIRIKNTFNPDEAGTLISKQIDVAKHAEKAISTTKTLSLITIQGKGMIGVPGVAARVFDIIAAECINILFISQASSEYNISFAVKQHDRAKAVAALENGLKAALTIKDLEAITYQDGLVIVAVVGEGMRHQPGVAGKIFSALGRCQANVLAIAQGSSERNISFIIEEKDMPKVLRNLHDEFHLVTEL